MRIGILWQRFGPYHVARMQAVAQRSDVVAIEVSSRDAINQWDEIADGDAFRRITLFPGCNSDELPPAAVVQRLRGSLDGLDLDVLCLPSWSTNHALGGLDWSIRRGVPAVCMTDSTWIDHRRRWWKERVKRQIVQRFAAAHVSGRASRDYVASLGIPKERIFLGMDVVDHEHFARGARAARAQADETRRALGLPQRYLVTVARLIPTKNIQCLLHALAWLHAHRHGCGLHLVLVGGGPEEPALRHLADQLGIASVVRFVGNQPYEQVPKYLALAEAFVLSSLSETWGLAVNEAMAAGLPALVSERCGCVADLVEEGVTGFTFDPLSAPTLGRLLLRLEDDELLRQSMGRAGQAAIEPWSLDYYAENLLAAARCARQTSRPGSSFLSRGCLSALMCRHNPIDTGPVDFDPRARPSIAPRAARLLDAVEIAP